jgi:hypothetical protein
MIFVAWNGAMTRPAYEVCYGTTNYAGQLRSWKAENPDLRSIALISPADAETIDRDILQTLNMQPGEPWSVIQGYSLVFKTQQHSCFRRLSDRESGRQILGRLAACLTPQAATAMSRTMRMFE